MNEAFEISIIKLAAYLFLFVIPILFFRILKLKLTKELIISIIRMVGQLTLVALYLEYIFKINNPLINFAWVLLMIIVANFAVIKQGGLNIGKIFFYTFPAYLLTAAVIFISLIFLFNFEILLSARYLIPLIGMVLGNILRSNVVGLDRFYSELDKREHEYIHYISLGAKPVEAVKPFLREAFRAAAAPQIATMSTIGLVSLPGMMTGQILGGSSPVTAIKYQIVIMTAIFVAVTISVYFAIYFSQKAAFDEFNRLDRSIYKREA